MEQTQTVSDLALIWWNGLSYTERVSMNYKHYKWLSTVKQVNHYQVIKMYEAEHPQDTVLETPKNYVGVKFTNPSDKIIRTIDFQYVGKLYHYLNYYFINKDGEKVDRVTNIDRFNQYLADGTWVIVDEPKYIELVKEPKEMYKNTKVYEQCIYCKRDTNTWDKNKNRPICVDCADNKNSEILPKEASDLIEDKERLKRNVAAIAYSKEIGNIDGTATFDFLKGAEWQRNNTPKLYSEDEVFVLMEASYVKGYNDKSDGKDHTGEKLIDWIKSQTKTN